MHDHTDVASPEDGGGVGVKRLTQTIDSSYVAGNVVFSLGHVNSYSSSFHER